MSVRQSPRLAELPADAATDDGDDAAPVVHDHDHEAAEMAAQSLEAERLETETRRRAKQRQKEEREEGLGGAAARAKERSAARQLGSEATARAAPAALPPPGAAAAARARSAQQEDALPPSGALGGATSTALLFYEKVLSPVRQELLQRGEEWSEAFEPLAAVVPTGDALLLCEECCALLHEAYAAGLEYPASQALVARACFESLTLGPAAVMQLFPLFAALHAGTPPSHLEIAWWDLWEAACDEFVDQNGRPTDMISAECELEPLQAPSPRDERRTSAYLAGWALLKVRKAIEKTKGLAHLKSALTGLSLPQGSSLPADDPAAGYLAARQQFGALTIPTRALIDAFTLARHMLTLKLQTEMEQARPGRQGRKQSLADSYQRAATAVMTDSGVQNAFRTALGLPAECIDAANAATSTAAPLAQAETALLDLVRHTAFWVSISCDFWTWEVARPPQARFRGKVTSWLLGSVQGEEQVRISWEHGRDVFGTVIPGLQRTALCKVSELLKPGNDFRIEQYPDGRAAPTAPAAATTTAAPAAAATAATPETEHNVTEQPVPLGDLEGTGETRDADTGEIDAVLVANLSKGDAVTLLLLRRFLNSAAAEYRKAVISLTGLDKNEGSIAIRGRLKVAQVKVANEDLPTVFQPKVHLCLPERLLHDLLCILVSDSPEELSRPTGVQMQAILRAYYPADADISASLLKDGASKSMLQAAIVAAISARGVDAGFARYAELSKITGKLK